MCTGSSEKSVDRGSGPMAIDLNWEPIAGSVLIAIGAVWSLITGGLAWRKRQSSRPPRPERERANDSPTAVSTSADSVRSADAPAPAGAVEWVVDILAAMGKSDSDSVLEALTAGESRDTARARRIAALESVKVISFVAEPTI